MGNVVIPVIFEICYPFKSGIAVVMDTLYEFKLVTKSGRILEYNDKNIGNKELLPPRYSYPGSFETKTGQGRVNKKGDTVLPPIYQVTCNLSEHRYIVKLKDKWGVCDDKGNIIVRPKFDYMFSYRQGLAEFKLDNKWGYINKKGKIVIPPKYDFTHSFWHGLAYVEINGKSGYINRRGRFVIQPIFEPCASGSGFK